LLATARLLATALRGDVRDGDGAKQQQRGDDDVRQEA
jgi:hypothetical protein